MSQKSAVQLVLTNEGGWRADDFDARLRRFLKMSLRGYGLRAKDIAPVAQPDAPAARQPLSDNAGNTGDR